MTETPSFAARAAALAHELVRWPSVTGSPEEADFADRLKALLLQSPAFADDPTRVRLVASHGSPLTHSVAGLVRGRGRRCVVLAGHFDTVGIDNYGEHRHLACEPAALAQALIAALEARERTPDEDLALADFRSGDFVPGRGMLDMKSGLAAGLAAAEAFAARPEREGNLLFLATPDEENRSRGMRSLRDALPALAAEWDLDIVGGINLDAMGDMGDGSQGRSVHYGTVGKFLPFVFALGRGAHAGYPFRGVSAHLISAEIIRAMESNPELSDEAFGEASPPPVCLEAKDLRQGYDVTTPEAVFLAFNWLTHRRSGGEMLADFGRIVEEAMNRALAQQHENGERFAGNKRSAAPRGRLMTFAELKQEAFRAGGTATERRFDELAASLRGEESPVTASRALVQLLIAEAGLEGPLTIIGFGSLVYPFTHVGSGAFRSTVERAAETAAGRHGTSLRSYEFFSGISDMSFYGHRPQAADSGIIAANTPLADFVDHPPADTLEFPVVNIGPWGRDLHQKLERVHAPYTFGVLPQIVFGVAGALLSVEVE